MKLKNLLRPIAAIALFGVVANVAVAQETAPATQAKPAKRVDPSGTWRFEVDVDGQVTDHALELQLGKDGEVSGIYKSPLGEAVDIKSGKVDGDQLVVDLEIEYQGTPLAVKLDGKAKDDDIDGDIVVTTPEGDFSFAWVAKRSVKAEDVVGSWELEIDAVETILEPIVEIKLDGKELKGTYKDPDSGTDVVTENLRVENNVLKFTIKSDFQGAPLVANFEGRPYGSKIRGSIEYDIADGQQVGNVDFEGVRKSPKKDAAAKDEVKSNG